MLCFFAQFDEFFPFDLPFLTGVVEEEEHGRAVVDGAFQLLSGLYLDELGSRVAYRVVIAVAVGFLDDDFVFHPVGVWDADDFSRVFAGNTGCGRQRERRRTAGAD